MKLTSSSDKPFWRRLFEQLTSYSVVGTTTFVFDLVLLWVLLFMFDITQPLAIGAAFLVAVHINYIILNFWTYRRSLEKVSRTYAYFITLTLALAFIIPTLVVWLNETFSLDVIIARIMIGGLIGLMSFFFNSFLNFKHI